MEYDKVIGKLAARLDALEQQQGKLWADTIAMVNLALRANKTELATTEKYDALAERVLTVTCLFMEGDMALSKHLDTLAGQVAEAEKEAKRAWRRVRHVEDRYNSNVVHVTEVIGALEKRVAELEAWRKRLVPTLERVRDNTAGGFQETATALKVLAEQVTELLGFEEE